LHRGSPNAARHHRTGYGGAGLSMIPVRTPLCCM
jgi:hypothetical protein